LADGFPFHLDRRFLDSLNNNFHDVVILPFNISFAVATAKICKVS